MKSNKVSLNKRILRLREVLSQTGLSRSTLYTLVKANDFPRMINLGPRSVGWLESEVDEWIAQRVQTSRAKSN